MVRKVAKEFYTLGRWMTQHRIREAVRNCMLVTEMRQQALNRLLP
ncbi:MAG: hypothetical protein WCH13_16750 [Deltaproteobacteria bacterium]